MNHDLDMGYMAFNIGFPTRNKKNSTQLQLCLGPIWAKESLHLINIGNLQL